MTSRIFNYPINLTSASGSTIGTIISTTISASNANYTTLTTGTLLVPTTISAGSCITTIGTIVGTSITIGTVNSSLATIGNIVASTGISSGTYSGTSVSVGTLNSSLATIGNIVASTTVSSGTYVGTSVSVGTLNSSLATIGNIVSSTTISSGTYVGTSISIGTLNGSLATIGNIVASTTVSSGTYVGTSISVGNISVVNFSTSNLQISGNISGGSSIATIGTLRSSDIFVTGTLTSVNITTQNLLQSNGTLIANNITTGGIFVSTGGLISTTVSSGTIFGSSSTISNMVHTNISSSTYSGTTATIGNIVASTTISSGTYVGTSISVGTLNGSLGTISNMVHTNISTGSLDVNGNSRITNTTATSVGTLTVSGPGSSTYLPATATQGQLASFYGPGGGGIISNFDLSTFIPNSGSSFLPSVRFSMLDLSAANSSFNILTKVPSGTSMASRIFIDGSGNVGINTTSPTSRLNINPIVVDANTFDHSGAPVTITNPTPTGTSTLNDQLPILHLSRQGLGGQSFGSRATFALSRYENNGVNSRTRLDIQLSQSTYNIVDVMSIRGDGNVGINNTAPAYGLDLRNTNLSCITGTNVQQNIFIGGNQGASGTFNGFYGGQIQGGVNFGQNTYLALGYNSNGTFTERMRINDSNCIGIGTSTPAYNLDLSGSFRQNTNVNGSSSFYIVNYNSGSSAYSIFSVGNDSGNNFNMFLNSSTRTNDGGVNTGTLRNDGGPLRLQSAASGGIYINTSGNVGIGTSNPVYRAEISQDNTGNYPGDNTTGQFIISGATDSTKRFGFQLDTTRNFGHIQVVKAGTTAYPLILNGIGGNVGIGTTSPGSSLHVAGNLPVSPSGKGVHIGIDGGGNSGIQLNGDTPYIDFSASTSGIDSHARLLLINSSTLQIIATNVAVIGALSKSSGSFDIQHPLSENKNDRLIHSFIEGSRCDNIYSGKKQLINGTITVNLDSECVESLDCGMTQGTFEALNKNTRVYLQNNDSFDRIRGTINGNILTITSENVFSTDTIDWMVIGERKDPFIKTWERTNNQGSLITEYKSE